jgi:hypothetical protein
MLGLGTLTRRVRDRCGSDVVIATTPALRRGSVALGLRRPRLAVRRRAAALLARTSVTNAIRSPPISAAQNSRYRAEQWTYTPERVCSIRALPQPHARARRCAGRD